MTTQNLSRFFLIVLAIFALQGINACGGDDDGTNQSYEGTITDSAGTVGNLQLNFNTDSSSNNVQGSFDPRGSSEVALSGSLNAAGILTASGGGYTFTGATVNGFMTGTLTGPNSSTGAFTALNSSSTVTEYCGVFSGDSSGVWSMEISSNNNVAASSTVLAGSDSFVYTGTISNNAITLSSISGNTATGTLSGTDIQGTWHGANNTSGTFSVSSNGCD